MLSFKEIILTLNPFLIQTDHALPGIVWVDICQIEGNWIECVSQAPSAVFSVNIDL